VGYEAGSGIIAAMFRRYGSFEGGIDLPQRKEATLSEAIRRVPRAERLLLPLSPCGGEAARRLVADGERVSAGRHLAEAAGEFGVDVFAPLAGRIVGVAEARTISPDGVRSGPALEFEVLKGGEPAGPADPWDAAIGAANGAETDFDWRSLAADDLLRRLDGGGLVAARWRPEPLGRWARRAREKGCRVLVANGVEDQPYVTAGHRLLVERGADVVRGLAAIGRAVGAAKTVLAVDGRRTGKYRSLAERAHACGVITVATHPIYPVGADTILVKVLTRKEVPLGGEPLDARCAVTDPAACFAAWRWLAGRSPMTARVVTASGPAAGRTGNFFAPLGLDCRLLAAPAGEAWLAHGGTMSGRLCDNGAVVSAATDALVAMRPVEPVVPAPCIRCGWCTDHCPARLNVSALNDLYELAHVARAERLGAMACVECGVCTYVCPARLPLSQRVKQLKRLVRPPAAGAATPSTGDAP
jgi:Na+-translocating ferredoxin:NAD+ oxidoreductase subunit C